MFSRILIKLVDEAIIPAILLLVVRVLSVVFFSNYFRVPVELGPTGFIYPDSASFLLLNSYSTLAMICVIAIGLFYVLIKSNLFHDTHIHPSMTAKLFTLKLSSIIQTSFDIYSQGVIWLSYSFLLLIVSGLMLYFGIVYNWVFYVSLVLSFLATYFLVLDVEREIRPDPDNDMIGNSEAVLTWDEDDVE